jgi:hypothetical protein
VNRLPLALADEKTERAGHRHIAEKIPSRKIILPDEAPEPGYETCGYREEIMFEFTINNRRYSEPRPGLYSVWIRAHEVENAPLIGVWIDPSMATFEPQTRGNDPAFVATQTEAQTT